jgi:hypothetical protein
MSNPSILNKFGLSGDLFSAIAENIDNLQSTARTQSLTVGKTVKFTGSINGVEVPAEVTLREANLSRLSVLRQSSPYTGKEYLLVTGVMNPVKLDLTVKIDGESMSIVDLLHAFAQDGGNVIERQKFEDSLTAMGMNYSAGMPLFFQQFGAHEEGIKHAINAFKAAGAIDVTGSIENPGRIVAAYQHQTGVPMTSFELGTTDRDKSRTNQGFLNLVDASVQTFQRVYGLRLEAHVLGQKISDLPQAKVKEAEEKRKELLALSRQWVTNWSGSQQRIKVEKNGSKTPQNVYDPVNAPCGRFSLAVQGEIVSCDLWSNSARAEQTSVVVGAAETEEDPF